MGCEKEKRIRILLERYFEGMTTLEEERLLREYFSAGEDIPHDLLYARAIFGAFHDASSAAVPDMPAGFREKTRPCRRRGMSRTQWILTGAAASAAAAVFILIFVRQKEPAPAPETIYCYVNNVPVTDYETAARYAENTLELISGSLRQFEQIVEMVETISGREVRAADGADSVSTL